MRNCHDSHYIHCRNNLFFPYYFCARFYFFLFIFFVSMQSSFGSVTATGADEEKKKEQKQNCINIFSPSQRKQHSILICYYVVALHRKFVLSVSFTLFLCVCVCVFGFAEAEVISLSCMCTAFESSFCGLFPQEYGARIIEFGFQKDCAHCSSNYMDD